MKPITVNEEEIRELCRKYSDQIKYSYIVLKIEDTYRVIELIEYIRMIPELKNILGTDKPFFFYKRSKEYNYTVYYLEETDIVYRLNSKTDIINYIHTVLVNKINPLNLYKSILSDFDKVLFRTDENDKWKPGFLVDTTEYSSGKILYESSNGLLYDECIRYDEKYSHTNLNPILEDIYLINPNSDFISSLETEIGFDFYKNIFFNGTKFYIPTYKTKIIEEYKDINEKCVLSSIKIEGNFYILAKLVDKLNESIRNI